MAGHRNFRELRKKLADEVGKEKLAGNHQRAQERYEAEERRLVDIRKARTLTQRQLADVLGVDQSEISRLERRDDLFLSTLASYLEAMGGRLELHAVFDDTGERVELEIGELAGSAARDRCLSDVRHVGKSVIGRRVQEGFGGLTGGKTRVYGGGQAIAVGSHSHEEELVEVIEDVDVISSVKLEPGDVVIKRSRKTGGKG